jgi:hypothetical protein
MPKKRRNGNTEVYYRIEYRISGNEMETWNVRNELRRETYEDEVVFPPKDDRWRACEQYGQDDGLSACYLLKNYDLSAELSL